MNVFWNPLQFEKDFVFAGIFLEREKYVKCHEFSFFSSRHHLALHIFWFFSLLLLLFCFWFFGGFYVVFLSGLHSNVRWKPRADIRTSVHQGYCSPVHTKALHIYISCLLLWWLVFFFPFILIGVCSFSYVFFSFTSSLKSGIFFFFNVSEYIER